MSSRLPVVAIAGVPNCGKTSLFNAMTGLRHKVANYPGVTVEKKTGLFDLPDDSKVELVDLPGAYSLSSSSPDEKLAADFLMGVLAGECPPRAVICVVDACNLERNLYFASQVIDTGIPTVIALNMSDFAERRGLKVLPDLLSEELGTTVIPVLRADYRGIQALKAEVLRLLATNSPCEQRFAWCESEVFLEAARCLGEAAGKENSNRPCRARTLGSALLSGAKTAGSPEIELQVSQSRAKLSRIGIDTSSYESEQRYNWVRRIVVACSVSTGSQARDMGLLIDRLITHRIWGILVFFVVVLLVFQSVFTLAAWPMEAIDHAFSSLRRLVLHKLEPSMATSLIADGLIPGVGSVLIFVPQIAVLFALLSALEASGYLSRVAFLMDSLMRRVGLQGRSFIPMLSCFACAVPGIMCTRSIPSPADRMITILVAPLMSCSARLPVYTLLIAAFVPRRTIAGFLSLQGLVLFSMYVLGIVSAVVIAFVLRRLFFRGAPTYFVMEMPPYRLPRTLDILNDVWERIWIFLKNAGTIIVLCSIVLWFLASFPRAEFHSASPPIRDSYAGRIGQSLEPVVRPLGYDWRIAVSVLFSFAAREVFVSSMALVHNLEEAEESSESLVLAIRNARDPQTGKKAYSILTALSLMVFYVFSSQCVSTLAVCKRETGSARWPIFMFAYMTALAYLVALATYQLGSLLPGT